MGGLWAKNCRHRTDQGPPITIWSFLTGSGIKHAVLQAWLPSFYQRPNGRPRLQPPRPTLRRGRVMAGMGRSMREGIGGGDKLFNEHGAKAPPP